MTKVSIDFNLNIDDPVVRDNFDRLQQILESDVFRNYRCEHFSFYLPEAGTFELDHLLGFIPEDVIVTSVTGGATVDVDLESADENTIEVTTDAETTIRCFLGTYEEGDI
jgi:hypothetical protein